ncbi:MAG TPA: PP2C family protein-serine/threonine phosphatase [Ignavibacteria bacterium]|nr:PP2C family protein-serine/threonine phosphatase [Ignavibacteria bacterium]HMR41195.1 PP2C family protein-serine/threonine phosphatase [Ignavibacteria bacterium]
MEIAETFDRFLNLPRERAYNQYLDEKNLKVFKRMLFVFELIFSIIVIVNLEKNESFNVGLILALINLLLLTISLVFYKKLFRLDNIRKYVFTFILLQFVMFVSLNIYTPDDPEDNIDNSENTENVITDSAVSKGDADSNTISKSTGEKKKSGDSGNIRVNVGKANDDSFIQYMLFTAIMILIFKFSRTEIIQMFASVICLSILGIIIFNTGVSLNSGVPNLLIALMFFVIAIASERKRKKNFLEQYDVYYAKNYENLRMKKELNYAREIQLSMLPKNDAVIGDIEISAVSLPASEVGGDYFDYFKVSEHEIGFFICDVSGHGVASGLLLSGLRSCMHLILEDNTHPKEVIEKLNRMIRKTQSRKMFVTAVFAIMDTEKNKCMLYNAGHLPPYKISEESKEIYKIKKHGLALGAMNTVEHADDNNEVVFDFNKGDKLILYTDGVNEAMNSSKAEYGLDNLEIYLNNNPGMKANELLNGIVADVRKFTSNSVQRDDLTILIIQRN